MKPLQAARERISPYLMARRLGRKGRDDLEKIGSGYGGWVVPTGVLHESSICYCAGVGEDVSFDLGLISRFGCRVWGIDPTPRSAAYVAETISDARFHFVPEGLWSKDSVQRFYEPANPSHVSHSIVNLQRTENFFEARCRRLSQIASANGHAHIDLLKLDIEGAEYDVLRTLHEDAFYPTIIAVEFDQPTSLAEIGTASRALKTAGYRLVSIDRWNYTFVRD